MIISVHEENGIDTTDGELVCNIIVNCFIANGYRAEYKKLGKELDADLICSVNLVKNYNEYSITLTIRRLCDKETVFGCEVSGIEEFGIPEWINACVIYFRKLKVI